MVSCRRCGLSFDAVRLSREGSCPRCRLRDGVRSPLTGEGVPDRAPIAINGLADAPRRLAGEVPGGRRP